MTRRPKPKMNAVVLLKQELTPQLMILRVATVGWPLPDFILSAEGKQEIAAADFEAAAISAAMLMEERAVQFYSGRAVEASDCNEKALFAWLSRWEQGHLSFLNDLDREIKAAIWEDNQFWPF